MHGFERCDLARVLTDQHKTLEDVEDSGFDGDDGSDDEKGATLSMLLGRR